MTGYPSPEIASLATGDGMQRSAPCCVSNWAIRAWCAAVGIDLAHFIDPAVPDALIAPPPMLQCWAGSGLVAGHDASTMHAQVRGAFLRAGFGAVVATDYEQDYLGVLHTGDTVHEKVWIESISTEKQTALGRGHFVTIRFDFFTAAGEQIGRLRVRTLYFDPATQPVARQANVPVPVGDLPEVNIPVTPTLVIAGSIASNDFEAVHHDVAVARAQGLADIILSIVTTSGLVWRYALTQTDAASITRLRLRLGGPAVPGDTLRFTAQWQVHEGGGSDLEIAGDTQRGRHVLATIATTR